MSAPKGYVSSLSPWQRLVVNRNWIAFWFMLPAAGFLIMFLAYPLGLGVWMSFTDVRIGRPGVFIGLENYVAADLMHYAITPRATERLDDVLAAGVAGKFHDAASTSSRTRCSRIVLGAGRSK